VIREGIGKLVCGENLTSEESKEIMREIMLGQATDSQIAAFLAALRMRGETIEEITAFASITREFSQQIHPRVNGRLVDTCGTGGDRLKTFNVSTAAAFVVAGAGVSVAKHGNRSVTSKSGSADVLEKLGLNLNTKPTETEKAIEAVGIGFMFAPIFHPAMKYAIKPRKDIGIRTVFNILGPLTNPANADAQLLGVYDKALLLPLAHVLRNLGCEEAMIVHGLDGLDEISTVGKTLIAWLKENETTSLELSPRDFGIKKAEPKDIVGTTPDEGAEIIFRILNHCDYSDSLKRDLVLVNAAAGIMVGGKAEDLSHGVELAKESIDSGAAYSKLKMLIKVCGDPSKLEELESRYD